ncbi:MAG: hypothetical protein K0R10_1801, partial [Alphaproteobacteria bacterium]|nr:hypothetical protein [Alphaproteobacteria bacterium]
TAFADFDAKCKTALSRLDAATSLAESGYGLGFILKQHHQASYTPRDKSPDGLNHFRIRDARDAAPAPKNRLFLVDDDPVALKRHGEMLEDLYEITSYLSPFDAVQAFASARPDLVVSDLNMPDMDGTGLRRALSELPGGNTTPFIFLSADHFSENADYISELGVDDFLTKPVARERLRNVVSRLITRSLQVRQGLEGKFQQQLTNTLKPSLPESYGGWRIALMTQAAEAGGGDFTLHHETPTHMLCVLADVMGHGEQAKFFSYAYAGYLRGLFRLQAEASDPAQFLKALSKAIDGDAFLESVLLTCQSFQLFPKGAACIASAGHPAPIVCRADGAETVAIAGPLPVLASENGYAMKSLQLDEGDKIIFATDGFLDAFEEQGRSALLKLSAAHAATTPQELAEILWRAYAKAEPRQRAKDDATIIIAGYGGQI